MKGNKLTREEHIARALLLGRSYDPMDGSYTKFEPLDLIHCETLEEMVWDEKGYMDKLKRSYEIYGVDVAELTMNERTLLIPPQPWEAPDDNQ